MQSNYILQIHTGSFQNVHTDFETIRNKIEPILKCNQIKCVIVGWNLNKELNQAILNFFHGKGIECYFWLPVLSEIDLIKDSVETTNYTKEKSKNVQIIEDESFSFLCPSHLESYQNVCEVYEEALSDIDFDGVFLDKIRFASFANGYEEGWGCFCERCEAAFVEKGVDIDYLKELFAKHDEKLVQGHYDTYGHYVFEDCKVNHFYEIRAAMITDVVGKLCDYFHHKNVKVGLDIYAPFFAYLTGQDILALSKQADFLKPMFYRYTQAPAGMQYEYEAYIRNFPNTKSFQMNPISKVALLEQISFLKNAHCDVYPGIEINPIENICDVNPKKFLDSRDFFQEHFETLVCCWNCLLMDAEIKTVL